MFTEKKFKHIFMKKWNLISFPFQFPSPSHYKEERKKIVISSDG